MITEKGKNYRDRKGLERKKRITWIGKDYRDRKGLQ